MTTFYARMLDAETGAENSYQFDGPDDLMARTADEVVSVFFREVEDKILMHHVDWELNGILAQRSRGVVAALGSLIPKDNAPPLPFLLTVSARNNLTAAS
jgi:hypothetical protein